MALLHEPGFDGVGAFVVVPTEAIEMGDAPEEEDRKDEGRRVQDEKMPHAPKRGRQRRGDRVRGGGRCDRRRLHWVGSAAKTTCSPADFPAASTTGRRRPSGDWYQPTANWSGPTA